MKKTIWYMAKPGEERDYAMTKPPNPWWAEECKKQGYVIFSVEVDLPLGWDSADHELKGRIAGRELPE